MSFHDENFFLDIEVIHWLKEGSLGHLSFIFATTISWAWRHRNLMCLNNEIWTLSRLSYNIHNMVDSLNLCFKTNSQIDQVKFIGWNNDNYSCVILNVDGSCMGTPAWSGFGGIIRNSAGYYLFGFSGCINVSSDIMYAEFYAIYQGLILAKSLNVIELVCCNDSLHCIDLPKGPPMRYRVYDVLIQDIKDLIGQNNVIVCHILLEREITMQTSLLNWELIQILSWYTIPLLWMIYCIFLGWTHLEPFTLESSSFCFILVFFFLLCCCFLLFFCLVTKKKLLFVLLLIWHFAGCDWCFVFGMRAWLVF